MLARSLALLAGLTAVAHAETGVLRIDPPWLNCQTVTALPDGGAVQMCTFQYKDCGMRTLGANGEERDASERVAGACKAWAARPDGGGFLTTGTTVWSFDATGHNTASAVFSSKEFVDVRDLVVASDGDVIASLTFGGDLMFAGKKLGSTKFSSSGFVRLRPALDKVTGAHLLTTRRTIVEGLTASPKGGFDAVISTKGPLVRGAPVNPPEPADGSEYGGNTYGWKAERVSFAKSMKPGARVVVGPTKQVAVSAAIAGTAVVALTANSMFDKFSLTQLRTAKDQTTAEAHLLSTRLHGAPGTPWMFDCAECTFDNQRYRWVGPRHARELGGAQRVIELREPAQGAVYWTSLQVSGDNVAATASLRDGKETVHYTLLTKLVGDKPVIDIAALRVVDGRKPLPLPGQ